LIRQAIRELHIDIEPHNRQLDIAPVLTPIDREGWANADRTEISAYLITGTNRKGDALSLKIDAETPYPKIVDQLKAAWKGS